MYKTAQQNRWSYRHNGPVRLPPAALQNTQSISSVQCRAIVSVCSAGPGPALPCILWSCPAIKHTQMIREAVTGADASNRRGGAIAARQPRAAGEFLLLGLHNPLQSDGGAGVKCGAVLSTGSPAGATGGDDRILSENNLWSKVLIHQKLSNHFIEFFVLKIDVLIISN